MELAIAIAFAGLIGAATAVSPFLGIGLLALIIYVALALIYPMLNGYVVIIAVALTSGMKRGDLIPQLIPNELALAGSVALALPFILTMRWRRVNVSGGIVIAILVFYVGTIFLPAAIHKLRGIPLGFGDLFSLFAPAQYALLFFLYKYLPQNEKERKRLIWLMLFMALIIAVVGLLQAAGVQPVWQFLFRWYPSAHLTQAAKIGGRATSLLAAWNSLGTFLMLTLLLVRSLQSFSPGVMNSKSLGIFALVFMLCMVASGSYASIAGLIIGGMILELLNKRLGIRFIMAVLVGGLISYIVLEPLIAARAAYQSTGSDGIIPQTLAYRFKLWQNTFLPQIFDNWLWGIQPIIPKLGSWAWAENQYLYVLYRGGIIALTAHFMWVIGTLVWLRGIFSTQTGLVKSLAATSIAMMIVLSIMAMTNEVFTFSGVIDYLWIFLGIAASDEQIHLHHRNEVE